jgi:hypothetical protein
MRLVASSDPGDVDIDQALYLLAVRAVMTRAVCRELLESGGYSRRAHTALGLLLEWLMSIFPHPKGFGVTAREGLDAMVVPERCAELLREIQDGAEVCEALAFSLTADLTSEREQDDADLARKLDAYWKAHAQVVNAPFVHQLKS